MKFDPTSKRLMLAAIQRAGQLNGQRMRRAHVPAYLRYMHADYAPDQGIHRHEITSALRLGLAGHNPRQIQAPSPRRSRDD